MRLTSHELALVIAPNRDLPTQPTVRILHNPDGTPAAPEVRHLDTFDGYGFVDNIAHAITPARAGLEPTHLLQVTCV